MQVARPRSRLALTTSYMPMCHLVENILGTSIESTSVLSDVYRSDFTLTSKSLSMNPTGSYVRGPV
jgi:hypothetical protein